MALVLEQRVVHRPEAALEPRGLGGGGQHAGPRVLGHDLEVAEDPAHGELAEALTDARDATAEIAYVLDVDDAEAAKPYVYEWRGALFRVRLAQLRLASPAPAATAPSGVHVRSVRRTLLAWALVGILLLVALGLIAFALGAFAGTR